MWLSVKLFFRLLFKRNTPVFIFATRGINDNGQVELEMHYNRSFLKHIRDEGFIGHSEEECIQMFMMSFTKQPESDENVEHANPGAHPMLNAENGNRVRQ